VRNDLKNGKVFLGTFNSTLLIDKVDRLVSAPNKIEVDYFGQKMCDLSLFGVVIIDQTVLHFTFCHYSCSEKCS